MSASITIRNVPEETHAELASRAAQCGQSLQEYLCSQLVELARRPDAKALMARVRSRKESAPSFLTPKQILEFRDRDRR